MKKDGIQVYLDGFLSELCMILPILKRPSAECWEFNATSGLECLSET
jgi:hypothetical protein